MERKVYIVKKKDKEKGASSKNSASGPSTKTTVYKGPIKPLKAANQVETFETVQVQTFDLVTNGAGVVSFAYGSWPSSTTDWSNAVAVWHEARTLKMRVQYAPQNRYSRGVITVRPIVTLVDHTDSTTVSSYATAGAHESSVLRTLDDPWTQVASMNGNEEAVFQDTNALATAANRFFIKGYSDGNTTSSTIGVVMITYLVQFRGRR